MTKRPIKTHKLTWRGIALVIREQHDYLWPGQSHVEVYVVSKTRVKVVSKTRFQPDVSKTGVHRNARPKHAVLPITETGYRSHFIDTEELSLAGGAVSFVTDWLDREAITKKWQRAVLEGAQLELDL